MPCVGRCRAKPVHWRLGEHPFPGIWLKNTSVEIRPGAILSELPRDFETAVAIFVEQRTRWQARRDHALIVADGGSTIGHGSWLDMRQRCCAGEFPRTERTHSDVA